MINKTNITVVGAGYVGMSIAILLARTNNVKIYDIDKKRVDIINSKQSTIEDSEITNFLKNEKLSLTATSIKSDAYVNADFIIIAAPTNYDEEKNFFDTSILDNIIEDALSLNKEALVIIKSTLPLGHTEELRKKFKTENITFSPEFLREGSALKDNLYPSRIIIGSKCSKSKKFIKIMVDAALKKDIEIQFIESTEAEAVKLFANTYLAMRVAFFNELDSYALVNDLDTKNIINGMCFDSRIGFGYNNPSFGYGGYCLPKDTKQLLSNYNKTPQKLIEAIISSNETRKDFISSQIIDLKPKVTGFYRLVMKHNSDNFRSSAIQDIIKKLKEKEVEVLIYEPSIEDESFEGIKVVKDLQYFKEISDVVIANRYSDELKDIKGKLFTRDIFNDN